jgi:hypothetical protein
MSLIKAKQIDKVLGTLRTASSAFTVATGASVNVTTAFTGKTSGGSNTAVGVFTSSPANKVVIIISTTGKPLTDAGGANEVYGRLTFAAAVWTLTFYSGNDVPYTISAGHPSLGVVANIIYGEAVQLSNINATDVIYGLDSIDETSVDSSRHAHVNEVIAVTSNGQTAFTLTGTPLDVTLVEMQVNGQNMQDRISVSGTTVTYTATDFPLETTDTVRFIYTKAAL